jgi:carbamoyltransferase
MTLSLGISEDLFDAGVTLCADGRILFASNEERHTRRKNEGGFPHRALEAALRHAGVTLADIDRVCVSGLMTPPLPVRAFPRLHDWSYAIKRERRDSLLRRLADAVTFLTPMSHTAPDAAARGWAQWLLPKLARRRLRGLRPGAAVDFVDHHEAHAAAACTLSGYDEALCVTADGMGDGHSLTVSHYARSGAPRRVWAVPSRDSFGLFFEILTEAFGFVPCRDEGKLTGLAALGDPARITLPVPFALEQGQLRYTGPHGRAGVAWARDTLLAAHSREDVAAWAQRILEDIIVSITRDHLRKSGLRRLALAGGVFANVKLNQRLHELPETDAIFICPNMGDGGLSLGALASRGQVTPLKIDHVFFGDGFTEAELEAALREKGLAFDRPGSVETRTAELLADGKIVARFDGRMEWGPRALGNRSILAPACDPAVPDRLNEQLKRSDFMPFAPALPAEDGDLYVAGAEPARHAAEFMTVCFRCTPLMAERYPSVVHVDGTARAQFVRPGANPGFHRILTEYRARTGGGVMLNTSFNMHEEPIVRTPQEAVNAFLEAGLDALALGPFMVAKP